MEIQHPKLFQIHSVKYMLNTFLHYILGTGEHLDQLINVTINSQTAIPVYFSKKIGSTRRGFSGAEEVFGSFSVAQIVRRSSSPPAGYMCLLVSWRKV